MSLQLQDSLRVSHAVGEVRSSAAKFRVLSHRPPQQEHLDSALNLSSAGRDRQTLTLLTCNSRAPKTGSDVCTCTLIQISRLVFMHVHTQTVWVSNDTVPFLTNYGWHKDG